ncbi:hypothetical protein GE061_011707 [Apolygus lucorum]|uniref:cGMP-dependent protein kinase N-terminal coiled-coil domain-containing protein n=1 Tax=Apolygus lucorum TaxID=248454 RepID=A0A8S9Y0C8_APOLU|nr:hypothetical protein GE061_011707 [Apolygus lucorum]
MDCHVLWSEMGANCTNMRHVFHQQNAGHYKIISPSVDMSGGSSVGRTPADLEARIAELEAELRAKEGEILELRSQLDQFQSVFPFLLGTNNCNNNHIYKARKGGDERRKRAQGISAEPFDFQTIQELASNKFPVYNKSERSVKVTV